MLTTEQIEAMDDNAAQATFETIGAEFYGTDRFKTRFAHDTGTDRRNMSRWFEDGSRPPTWAILLLEAWNTNRQIMAALRMVNSGLQIAAEFGEG